MLEFKCYQCNKKFNRSKKDSYGIRHYGNNPHCSKECSDKTKKTSFQIECKNCGKIITKRPKELKKSKSGNLFCNRSCSATYHNKNKQHGTKRSKLETYLESMLTKKYPRLHFDFNQTSAINSELDIYIPSLKLAFELNGIFHYEPIFGEDKLTKTQNNDDRKFQACLEHNIELCVIDTSSQKYFKESSSQKFLDIITTIINRRLSIIR